MDKEEICRVLENDFKATFIEELIPGILHNFANPLNGIMGRSKLLQRRIEDNIKKIEAQYPETALTMKDDLQRIRTDIRAISQESEYFFDMFKDVAGKFYALAAKNEDRVNISQLLDTEMRFVNFYLDFKHEIKKDIRLDKEVPDLQGNTADLSLAFWRIIRFAMTEALGSQAKEFYIKTDHDQKYVNVLIKSSGKCMPDYVTEHSIKEMNTDSFSSDVLVHQGAIFSLILLNKACRAEIKIAGEGDYTAFSICFPYDSKSSTKK